MGELILREAALEKIRIVNSKCKNMYGVNACLDCADEINTLPAQGMEWISVEDRLPEEPGEYIVMTASSWENKPYKVMSMDFEICTFKGKDKRRWRWKWKLPPWPVTHWMPLPEPPKEG